MAESSEKNTNFRYKSNVTLSEFQSLIHDMYYDKDKARGIEGTFMWLIEEVGELSAALRQTDRDNLADEFADVMAWLATIANIADIDIGAAIEKKYGAGCPGCQQLVCRCSDDEKP